MDAAMNLSFDVAEAFGSSEPLQQAAAVFLPEQSENVKAVLICLPGGSYDKTYWNMEVPGHRGYSFARHLTEQGFVVVALDHLGIGESADPQMVGQVDAALLATGDAAVTAQIRTAVKQGSLAPQLPPQNVPFIGIGHSMGAGIATIVQAETSAYDAVALLGWAAEIDVHDKTSDELAEIVKNDETSLATLAARLDQSETEYRLATATPSHAAYTDLPREGFHGLFYLPDVPPEVIAADAAVASRVPTRAAAETITPGFIRQYARKIDVPIFLALGEVDVTPAPYAEPAHYPSSHDITLFVLAGSAHCHNFAGTRTVLWNRLASWAGSV